MLILNFIGYNGMLYVRGNRKDFNQYFKKSEGFQITEIINKTDALRYHNANGPMKIDLYRNKYIMKDVLIEATQELGYKYLLDINANGTIGMALGHGTLDGDRCCTLYNGQSIFSASKTSLEFIYHKACSVLTLPN